MEVAERLVITDGEGMEDLARMSAEERREMWREERILEKEEKIKKSKAKKPVPAVRVVTIQTCDCTNGTARNACGAKKCKKNKGGTRLTCTGQRSKTTGQQRQGVVVDTRSFSMEDIRRFNAEQKQLRETLAMAKGPEGAVSNEEAWQAILQRRAQDVTEATQETNVRESESSCVRGARAYLPTRR
jgi:hypothetical protein